MLKDLNKKPLYYAGVSGILLYVVAFILNIAGVFNLSEYFLIFGGLVFPILSAFFFYGFYYLGLKRKSKLLSVVACLSIVFIIIFYVVSIFLSGPIVRDFESFNQTFSQQQLVYDNLNATNTSLEELAVLEDEMMDTIMDFFTPYLIWLLVLVLIWMVFSVLFNISLIKLKKVEYAKITGIIGLVSTGLTLTLFGIFLALPLMFAYPILLIVILFNESKKLKER